MLDHANLLAVSAGIRAHVAWAALGEIAAHRAAANCGGGRLKRCHQLTETLRPLDKQMQRYPLRRAKTQPGELLELLLKCLEGGGH
jgi:hypothetical protein